ncbi:hypothetical protein CDD80_456 [Ophiocordyceps camponoti-rufipedis]|uniref:Core domain-containing protein n=1 Tax=Ophiocordyceps camponoti-rufipedis TaxID=2004952 RepID=A0A2C5ZCP3_9HYPO|nr:hypothetical protein CDD80_456 [Ophiocordyceps camponoti-rufipedis]
MMASLAVARAALRHCRRHPTARLLPTVRVASYHSYPLPSNAAPNADVTETPIAQPEPLPSRRYDSHGSGAQQVATPSSATGGAVTPKQKSVRPRTKFRPRKAAMRLTPAAVERLRLLLDQPEPKLIKVGVRNRGCSGLAYHLEYVDKPGAFDETVEQDGVTVLIDSKALFSIIGSEMDWAEDKLNQRFVFKNPNISKRIRFGT